MRHYKEAISSELRYYLFFLEFPVSMALEQLLPGAACTAVAGPQIRTVVSSDALAII